ncbi:UNVERIFIED_CONTAM: hypothetical protein GTU68_022387 [Idotea baltica]|nr:hypothetical protein [Idotea baltica]
MYLRTFQIVTQRSVYLSR